MGERKPLLSTKATLGRAFNQNLRSLCAAFAQMLLLRLSKLRQQVFALQFQRVFPVSAFLMSCAVGAALAQTVTQPGALSDQQKAAIGVILDSLTTKAGQDLKNSVLREIDGFSNDPKGADSIVSAVKMGAGPKLPIFQDILVSQCLIPGGRGYCRLAAVPAPQTESSNIQTSATGAAGGGGGGAGGGAGGGGAGGGGPQTNYGHNTQNNGPGNPLGITSSPQQFSFSRSSFGGSSGLSTAAAVRTTLATPGPQAGAGLVSALLTVASLLWARRSSKRT